MRFLVFVFLIYSFAYAKTPYELGKELYMSKACFSCHGNKADGMHNYPRLANRAKGFLTYKSIGNHKILSLSHRELIREFEFNPDRSNPGIFKRVIVESMPGNAEGTRYKLKELFNEGIIDVYDTGVITLRVID